jgi:hypothetical protein
MYLPNNKCHKCHEFMEIEKINGEYVMFCPCCDKKKEKDEE